MKDYEFIEIVHMKPKISVIIPTKNEGKYLERTLKQYIPVKKKFKIEVIVSDAGSEDNTIRIAKKYADRVVVARNGQKQNIAIGRNAGARAARGGILFHTDADVIIPKIEEFFLRIVKLFKNGEIIAATTRLKVYPKEEIFYDKVSHFFINSSIRLANHFNSFIAKGECQIVRASTFKKIKGYDEHFIAGEDCNLFYRLKKIGKVAYVDALAIYHSPRRFRQQGYLRLLFIFLTESVYLLITGKSFLGEWKPMR